MSDTRIVPTLGTITRHAGIAGQYALSVPVTYPGEHTTTITFTGSVYGGPILVSWPDPTRGVFVSSDVMTRCGDMLTPEWVRCYFS